MASLSSLDRFHQLLMLFSISAILPSTFAAVSYIPPSTTTNRPGQQQQPSQRLVQLASQVQMPTVPSGQQPPPSTSVGGTVSVSQRSAVSSNPPTVTAPAASTLCFEDELEYVERCYRFISYNVTWYEAESICMTRHGHLATVTSLLKNNWIVQNMAAETWIGLQRLGAKNTSRLGFLPTHEEPQRTFLPNKLNYGNQSCFYLRRSSLSVELSTLFFLSTGVWQDDYCYSKHYAVCERDPVLPRGGRVELNYQRTNKLGQLIIQMRHTVEDLKREATYREKSMHEKFSLAALWTWFKALAVLTMLSVILLALSISWIVIQLRNKRIITLPSRMPTFGANNLADFAARRRTTNNAAGGSNFHRLSESSSRVTLEDNESYFQGNGDALEEAAVVPPHPVDPPPPLPWSTTSAAQQSNGPSVKLESARPQGKNSAKRY